jgi:hypothetical protein
MRYRKVVLAPIAAGLAGSLALVMSAPAGAQEGEANGIRGTVNVIGGTLLSIPNTPHEEQPPGGSSQVAGLPGAVAPAATASILAASSDANGSSAAVADLTAVNGLVPGVANVLTADAISSECSGADGSSSLVNAVAAGVPALALSPPPNTTVPVPGVGSLVLNEQTSDAGGITVRAVHLTVNVAGIVTAEIVISESVCLAGIEALAAEATAGDPNLTG